MSTAVESNPARLPAEPTRSTLLAAMWAAATLFHQAHAGDLASTPVDLLLTGAATAVLLRPSSARRFVAMALVQVVAIAARLPQVSNHWLMSGFVACIVLASAGLLLKRRGWRASDDGSALFAVFAPPLRASLIVLYFYVVFHKLNHDFFDPAISCGAEGFSYLRGWLPLLPAGEWTKHLALYATLLVEAAIPVLLIVPRWRRSGVVVAAVFHYVLAIRFFFDFSSMMFALLVTFIPDGASFRLPELGPSARARRVGGSLLVAALATVVVGAALTLWPSLTPLGRPFSQAVWWLYGLLFIYFAAACVRFGPPTASERSAFVPVSALLWLGPALVFLNGLSPYLGLKTETSLAMFSNLRTEGGETNHWLVPASLQVADYQRDLVTIRDISRPARAALRLRPGSRLPYFSLRDRVSAAAASGTADLRLSYARGDRTIEVRGPADDPALFTRPPYLLRKLLAFRALPGRGERNTCRH